MHIYWWRSSRILTELPWNISVSNLSDRAQRWRCGQHYTIQVQSHISHFRCHTYLCFHGLEKGTLLARIVLMICRLILEICVSVVPVEKARQNLPMMLPPLWRVDTKQGPRLNGGGNGHNLVVKKNEVVEEMYVAKDIKNVSQCIQTTHRWECLKLTISPCSPSDSAISIVSRPVFAVRLQNCKLFWTAERLEPVRYDGLHASQDPSISLDRLPPS